MHSHFTVPALLCFFASVKMSLPMFFIWKAESLSAAPGGAIIALLVVSTQHRDNVSWANERQRREDILTSIDPCKEEEAVGIRVYLRCRINIITNMK